MTQHDVYDFLKQNKGKMYTPKQVAEGMGISANSATRALARLRYSNMVKYNELKKRDTYEYWL